MIVLASASPRRSELLASAGIAFVVRASGVDETEQAGETSKAYVLRIAMAKALAADDHIDGSRVPVLAADTTVALPGRILGKPDSVEIARETLRELSGKTHYVHTAVVVRMGAELRRLVVSTEIEFRALTSMDIERYVATGESMDRAGAYAIQGGAGGFVHRIRGSYSNVVGLPVVEALGLLREVGVVPATDLPG